VRQRATERERQRERERAREREREREEEEEEVEEEEDEEEEEEDITFQVQGLKPGAFQATGQLDSACTQPHRGDDGALGHHLHEEADHLDEGVAHDEGVHGAPRGGQQLLAELLAAAYRYNLHLKKQRLETREIKFQVLKG
jgi:hypothetical protein